MTEDNLATKTMTPEIGDKVVDKWGKLFGTIVKALPQSDELVIAVFKGPYLTISYSQVYYNGGGEWAMLWDVDLDMDEAVPAPEEIEPQVQGIQAVLNERESRYGAFNTHAQITQAIKDICCGAVCCTNWSQLKPYQAEALDMIAHKIGRILNGDPNYIETWKDLAGYAQLVVNELSQTEGATDGRVVKQQVIDGKLVDIAE